MTERERRRWRRYAAGSALHLATVVAAVLLPLPAGAALTVFLASAVLLFFAIGPVQAHVAFNEDLDAVTGTRWRVAFVVVPGAIALYWHLHVR